MTLLFVIVFFVLILLSAFFYWLSLRLPAHLKLNRAVENPVLEPVASHWWESEAVFNPAAFYSRGRVHLFYRAMGTDGISRIGYASSKDGVHFDERLPYPVYTPTRGFGIPDPKARKFGPLSYDTHTYASGGGWGGSEDPRIVEMDDKLYMTFVAFDGWGFVRMALTSLGLESFAHKDWHWSQALFLSPPGEINKNWLLFPEKINGKFAILHSITPKILIEYVDDLSEFDGTKFITNSTRHGGRPGHWDTVVRGAGAPPIKTKYGWLLFYHGYDPAHPDVGYKVGAMLLDLADPTKILYRSSQPVLQAEEWYENDGKPGVTYASGAAVINDTLFVYYGGGDKRIAAASANLEDFLQKLTAHHHAALTPAKV
ncbi:MAG: hypothetical protein KGH79_03995 [Patescibacteria group bacterium]|nr:hypothetical protein [Patescibacteria group bacterium]